MATENELRARAGQLRAALDRIRTEREDFEARFQRAMYPQAPKPEGKAK